MNKKLNLNVLFYYLDEFLRNRLLNIYDQLFGCFCFVFVTYRVTNRQKSENIKLQRHNLKIMQEYNKNRELLMSQPKEVNIMGSLIAMESIVRFLLLFENLLFSNFQFSAVPTDWEYYFPINATPKLKKLWYKCSHFLFAILFRF